MKTKLSPRIFISILFLIFTAILLVMTIKPGAAVFFVKKPLIEDQVEYREQLIIYPIEISESFFNTGTILVRRNDQLFPKIKTEELPNQQEVAFAVERKSEDQFIVRIVPGLEQPADSELGQYQILVRPRFITQFWFKFLGISLGFAFLFSVISIFFKPGNFRRIITGKWLKLSIWDQPEPYIDLMRKKLRVLVRAISHAVLVSFFYVLMEWIFFVTKPSFMDVMSFGQKISVLFITSLAVSILIIILTFIIFCLDALCSSFQTTFTNFIYYIPTSLLAAGLVLLLIDNFTYTVFQIGVSTVTSWLRIFYTISFGVAFFFILRSLSRNEDNSGNQQKNNFSLISAAGIVLLSVILFFVTLQPMDYSSTGSIKGDNYRTPNIILVSDDGLNAENMSLYGYERETTPFLESIASTSLLMLNNFTNANTSTGSETALLTGKLPFATRVMYPPNTLVRTDTLEHLPGLLRKLGYQNISLSVPYFVDMGLINFQNGFDAINGNKSNSSNFISFASAYGFNDAAYLLVTLEERILTRIFHVFFIEEMENPYLLVTEPSPTSIYLNMSETYARLINSLNQATQAGQPLFAHIHMMSTHGPKFYSEEQVYSEGKIQNNNWMTDYYDDAILEYDKWLENLVDYLKSNGYYENTTIIFYTDHAEKWSAQRRVPLMIHFPGDEYAGEIVANSQNLDIGPTILDYMGMSKPQWMMGQSLLDDISRTRLVFSAEVDQDLIAAAAIVEEAVGPPFFQFRFINVIQCQFLYEINLKTGQMTRKAVPAYVDPCMEKSLDTPEMIWDSAMGLLSAYGYNIPEGWENPLDYFAE